MGNYIQGRGGVRGDGGSYRRNDDGGDKQGDGGGYDRGSSSVFGKALLITLIAVPLGYLFFFRRGLGRTALGVISQPFGGGTLGGLAIFAILLFLAVYGTLKYGS